MIDYFHEKDEDIDTDPSITKEEKAQRELLRTTIGVIKVSKDRGKYWSTDDNLRKLLRYRPSLEDMKVIFKPMCYLYQPNRFVVYQDSDEEAKKHRRYYFSLQKQLIEYFIEKYSVPDQNNK